MMCCLRDMVAQGARITRKQTLVHSHTEQQLLSLDPQIRPLFLVSSLQGSTARLLLFATA
jgi:hypothetical protein